MTQQQRPPYVPGLADPAAQIARLREVLALVRELAGDPAPAHDEAEMDDAARLSAAYACALPVDQKRFDALASETARWAAAGVEALIRLEEAGLPVRTAAAKLGEELERSLALLAQRLPG